VYLDAGGHEVARGAVAEDLALATAFASAGVPVEAHVDDGHGICFRMYPEGVRQLVEGWSKNLASGAGSVARWRSALAALWIAAALRSIAGPLVVYAAFAAQHAVLLRRVGGFRLVTALLWPVPLVTFVVLFACSAVLRLLRRDVRWRGRTVPA
jgi:4,4'-diaponeurosporenoate glycosyltransferase